MRIMKYKGYYGSLEYWMRHNMYHGSLQMISDKVTYEATDENELEKEFKLSVEDYLRYCKEVGTYPDVVDMIDV
jgi:predicted HicB family RNase H-like nuclease